MAFFLSLRIPLILVAGAMFTIACSNSDEPASELTEIASTMDTLVTAEWLSEHLDDPDLVVLDCSVTIAQGEDGGFSIQSGRENFEAGHIPTAGFADLMGDLSDNESPLRFAVPTPEDFVIAMGALGVGDDTRVILYDSSNSAWAARVWWMLRWAGFDNAALLDGGQNAWTAGGHPLSKEPAKEPPRTLTLNLRPDLIVDRDQVFAAIDDESINIIDALPEAQYRGEISQYGRPGHIPGASNVPYASLLDDTGHYRQHDELKAIFGDKQDVRTITYCGGGIAASSDAFVLTRLGFKDVAVYTASLQEWAADPANPLEVSAESDQ